MTNPPLVISISYSGYESAYSQENLDAWNTEAIKLGLQGVSIFAATGDAGVEGPYKKPQYCGYGPQFPVSSPYVTAVGATQGYPTEVACSAATYGTITSGGGFSNYFPTPSWQSAAVVGYSYALFRSNNYPYTANASAGYPPIIFPSYNSSGRGYPDISAWGAYGWIIIDGEPTPVAGTSLASPLIAAMVSLANAALLENGYSPMGFLNPFLYQYSFSFINDITIGNNNCLEYSNASVPCCSQVYCCLQGFNAEVGWDPVTGWGTMNHKKFVSTALEVAAGSSAPTVPPSGISPESKGEKAAIVVAGVMAGLFVLLAVGVVVFFFFMRPTKSSQNDESSDNNGGFGIHSVQNPVNPRVKNNL